MIFRTEASRAAAARVGLAAVALGVIFALGAAAGQPARADAPACNLQGSDSPFVLSARAYPDVGNVDVYATVTSTIAGCSAPGSLKKLQVKARSDDGSADGVYNYTDVAAPDGVAAVSPSGPTSGQLLELSALVQTSETGRTYVLHTEAKVAAFHSDGAVVSEDYQATRVGAQILREGGNAFDAAAGVQWALNVVEPENTGLGGGVNAIVHLANGDEYALDGRETTPMAVTPTYYQSKGRYGYARNGYSAGVPGTLRTMDYMLTHWGTMTLAQTLQPAIALADNGIVVSRQLATSINNRGWMDPDAKAVFYPNGMQTREGDTLVQHDLANTFRLIADQGPSAFYDGPIADAIVAAQRKSYDHDPNIDLGGVMTKADISAFDVAVMKPISVDYHGYEVESVGPSTAGGIVVLQMLKMVEPFPLGTAPGWEFQSANATQVMLEAMRLGFADQDFWMGDSAFYPAMPLSGLLSTDYLAWRSSLIHPNGRIANTLPGYAPGFGAAEPKSDESEPSPPPKEGGDTSQFTVVDRWGNVVSVTTTLGDGLGCTIMVPGYGFMLNDASGRNLNRAPRAGTTKSVLTPTGTIQIADPGANDAAGGKRGQGNVAPLIVEKDGKPILATGGAGGAAIMPVVFQIVSDVLDYNMPIQDALNAPRVWGDSSNVISNVAPNLAPLLLPSKLADVPPWDGVATWFTGAPAFPQKTLDALKLLGDPVKPQVDYPQVGGAESISLDPDAYTLSAGTDPRGLWAVGQGIVLNP